MTDNTPAQTDSTQTLLTPVVLSGGSGTRLWPLSRPERPKQFIALAGTESMMRQTLARTDGIEGATPPIIVANAAHADLVQAQLAGDAATVVLEPCARNTAPAIALAALLAPEPSAVLLVMPSDHVITDTAAFRDAVSRALPLARDGWMITLGIAPDGPETGYGYIAMGEALADGVQRVERFVEKPAREAAEAMLSAGNHVWNAGIFLFRADAYLDILGAFQPDMLAACRRAVESARRSGAQITPDPAQFAACPSDSIDYAVMEKADRVACVPVSMGWSDLGSWDSLYDLAATNGTQDAGATLIDSSNCLVRSDGRHVTLVGVSDLIVVADGDDIMIVRRGQSQSVKQAAEAAAARLKP